jgi:hypothetical protein
MQVKRYVHGVGLWMIDCGIPIQVASLERPKRLYTFLNGAAS